MIKKLLCFSGLLFGLSVNAQQFVINEIDSDQVSTDTSEFVEIKSQQPFTSLDGYVLVFINGSTSSSTGLKVYFSVDLSGLTTDANGLVVVGNNGVSPAVSYVIPNATIQNGPDVVAIYQGSIVDYQELTPASPLNLVHAIGHGNTATPPTELMQILGITTYAYENQNGAQTTHSILRNNDGTYSAGTPSPGALNDGTGITFNGVTITVDASNKLEGTSFPITFTTQQPVTTDLSFTYTLTSGSFNASDYVADLNVTIPAGQTSVTKTVQILDDGLTEGDEVLRVKFGTLPTGFIRMNDLIYINIVDVNFTVSNFGTPLNPTYGQVTPTYTEDYYSSLIGLSGDALKQAIQDIIANPNVVRKHAYGDVVDILKVADQNPLNSNDVWLLYSEAPRAKNLYQTTSVSTGFWNREHIFPQSTGGFAEGTEDIPDGINIWAPTSADDIFAGHSDAHHIRAEDGPVNSSRSDKNYGTETGMYNGIEGDQGSWKGDVARSLFYMAIRYNALDLVNGNTTLDYQMGDLATLLNWNNLDPADDFEMNRNNYIQTWQYNRNPFIDLPALASYIWGENAGQVWNGTLSNDDFTSVNFVMYPNPAKNEVTISGIENDANVVIYNMIGQKVSEHNFYQTATIPVTFESGVYLVKVTSNDKTKTQKLIVK